MAKGGLAGALEVGTVESDPAIVPPDETYGEEDVRLLGVVRLNGCAAVRRLEQPGRIAGRRQT